MRERSYNQALLLAREIAHLRGLPLAPGTLERTRDTAPQQTLDARERNSNMWGMFQVRKQLSGKSVLIIDDVMTTGAILAACAQALLEAGAGQVKAGVIGRSG